MELLFSNYPPMKTNKDTFADAFYDYVSKSTEVDIAVGYITSDSLAELKKLAEYNKNKKINLTIGMHYYDLFTRSEYNSGTNGCLV